MNLDLAKLGQIAGLAGIAIGAAVVLLRGLIEKGLGGVPSKDRARVVTTIAVCAFGIGVVGMATWAFGPRSTNCSIVTGGAQSPAACGGRDVNIKISR
jgi:hypothetical protein